MLSNATSPGGKLTGNDLRQMFAHAQSSLELHAASINALNVFPVPDGDTGTNMSLTLKAVEDKLAAMQTPQAGEVAAVIAHESLMGARGNSGVILSQFFSGMAQVLKGMSTFGSPEMAKALTRASEQAYKAVSKPVEGTILTVMKEAARAADVAAGADDTIPLRVWEQACHGARRALAETPDLLPMLKEAGVVDAGGLGLVAMMEGARAYLNGQEVTLLDIDIGNAAPTTSYLIATEEDAFGYCTQFLVEGEDLKVDDIRERIATMAHSTIVVGNETTVKVHSHAYDPGLIISYAVSLGVISQVKLENMDRQHVGFVEMHRAHEQKVVPLGVVAVAVGMGIEQIFSECGAVGIVPGGQTMNPSTRDLAECADRSNAAEVILLPNNSNIVASARQAIATSSKVVHVVPTVSIPQGIAALLAFNPDLDASANLAEMQAAAAKVRSGEVTRAVRSTIISNISVKEGQTIALLDGKLVASSDTTEEALAELCRQAAPQPGALITLYWGGDATAAEDVLKSAETLRKTFPEVDVEVVFGGQPHYDYLVSIE